MYLYSFWSLVCVLLDHSFSCPTLCEPSDCSLPGSSVHGILQARILEWVAILFSRRIFPTQESNLHLQHLLHWQASSLPLAPHGKPKWTWSLEPLIKSITRPLHMSRTWFFYKTSFTIPSYHTTEAWKDDNHHILKAYSSNLPKCSAYNFNHS